jgi:hypothetical protein
VADKIPPDTRKFTPENVAPCFAPVRGLASVPLATVAEASRSNGAASWPCHSTWLRIASIAELAWNPAGYRAERSAEYLLAGEGPEINEKISAARWSRRRLCSGKVTGSGHHRYDPRKRAAHPLPPSWELLQRLR